MATPKPTRPLDNLKKEPIYHSDIRYDTAEDHLKEFLAKNPAILGGGAGDVKGVFLFRVSRTMAEKETKPNEHIFSVTVYIPDPLPAEIKHNRLDARYRLTNDNKITSITANAHITKWVKDARTLSDLIGKLNSKFVAMTRPLTPAEQKEQQAALIAAAGNYLPIDVGHHYQAHLVSRGNYASVFDFTPSSAALLPKKLYKPNQEPIIFSSIKDEQEQSSKQKIKNKPPTPNSPKQ